MNERTIEVCQIYLAQTKRDLMKLNTYMSLPGFTPSAMNAARRLEEMFLSNIDFIEFLIADLEKLPHASS